MVFRRIFLRSALLAAAGSAWAECDVSGTARATPLSSAVFSALAARCAPSVPEKTLKAIAQTESGLDPWALHDNTTGVTEQPASSQAALSVVRPWIDLGDSVDIGLMQINSANLGALGITARTALDPCVSLGGAAAVLQAAYGGGKTRADQQAALLMALSRYNTGLPFRGIMNGYARKVMANDAAEPLPTRPGPGDTTQTDPTAPPSWNIWATASYVQTHGAPWLISLESQPSPGTTSVGQQVLASVPDIVITDDQTNRSTQPTTGAQ